MEELTVLCQVEISEGVTVLVETDEDVRLAAPEGIPVPENLARTIEEVGRAVMTAATALQPDKLGVEFGLEAGGEAGIPFVTKGTAKAAFKVALEWSRDSASGNVGP